MRQQSGPHLVKRAEGNPLCGSLVSSPAIPPSIPHWKRRFPIGSGIAPSMASHHPNPTHLRHTSTPTGSCNSEGLASLGEATLAPSLRAREANPSTRRTQRAPAASAKRPAAPPSCAAASTTWRRIKNVSRENRHFCVASRTMTTTLSAIKALGQTQQFCSPSTC